MTFINFGSLLLPAEPCLVCSVMSHSDLTNRLWNLPRTDSSGIAVRFLRGGRMKSLEGLYDEFAAAMQFPYYFGYNGAAFDECLADLEWMDASGYILTVFDAQELLVGEVPTQMDLFVQSLQRTCEFWNEPIAVGESWDRPAKPFHVIFHCTVENAGGLSPKLAGFPNLN